MVIFQWVPICLLNLAGRWNRGAPPGFAWKPLLGSRLCQSCAWRGAQGMAKLVVLGTLVKMIRHYGRYLNPQNTSRNASLLEPNWTQLRHQLRTNNYRQTIGINRIWYTYILAFCSCRWTWLNTELKSDANEHPILSKDDSWDLPCQEKKYISSWLTGEALCEKPSTDELWMWED